MCKERHAYDELGLVRATSSQEHEGEAVAFSGVACLVRF